jgi:hypothetical protein
MKAPKPVTRRRALQGAASLIGGTIAASQLGPFMNRAVAAAEAGSAPVFFDEAQFALLERIVDVMIPETDTPGAQAAGVHHFIDLMLAEWASPERQARYVDGMRDIGARLQDEGGTAFVSASPDRQLELLRTLDAAAFEDSDEDVFFVELKRMVLFGYYSSEPGATVELQYEPLIPDYKACVPIEDIGRAWFWLGFSHGL